jgi:hypothetical protein
MAWIGKARGHRDLGGEMKHMAGMAHRPAKRKRIAHVGELGLGMISVGVEHQRSQSYQITSELPGNPWMPIASIYCITPRLNMGSLQLGSKTLRPESTVRLPRRCAQ